MGLAYLFALLGAVAGAVTTFCIAKSLPSAHEADDKKAAAYFQPPPALESGGSSEHFQTGTRGASADLPRHAPDDRFKA
jgi:hypothetical protein